ncbi:MAG TPA: N-formylglutamate amidohydrolase [Alphaproteobacteria bacterium]|nr:N-formylglutamate amidohydrolase [Alphaproteobacteria bacterium]
MRSVEENSPPEAGTESGTVSQTARDPHPPFTVLRPQGDPRILIICDHACNYVPPEYDNLGLPATEFHRHIAWDIGAADVTRALSDYLDAPAVLSGFSRLLIDPNRGSDDPTLVMKLSDGAIIPGNRHVSEAELSHRVTGFYQPYHDAIAERLRIARAAGIAPVLISVHSFTPVFHGHERPWHVGILWDRDARIAGPLIDALRRDPQLCVGDNAPYSGELVGDSMNRHGTNTGLAHVLIELRQDLIDTPEGARRWATRLAGELQPILARQSAGPVGE